MPTDRVTVITGGCSGIGHATAFDLAARGAKVLVTTHRSATLAAAASAILQLADATAETVTRIFAVNTVGPSLLAAAALPRLEATKGAIVNISSTFGHKPGAGLSVSTAAFRLSDWKSPASEFERVRTMLSTLKKDPVPLNQFCRNQDKQ